ncbi:MAG: VOC family protein [Bacteroidota bacterium]
MKISIAKVQHIGIPTGNLEKSKEFYERLGFVSVMSSTFDHEGEKGRVVMMKSNKVLIEIYQLPKQVAHQNGHGPINHIAFDVDDIEKVYGQLKRQNFFILEDAPVFLPFWKNGCKYFNILGPNGERLEFNQII